MPNPHLHLPTRTEAAGARAPSASAPLPVLLEAASPKKSAVAPAPHRPPRRAADATRPAAPDYRTTPEARGYGAG